MVAATASGRVSRLDVYRRVLIGLTLVAGIPSAATARQAEQPQGRRIPDDLNFANGLYRDRRYDLAAEEYEKFLKTAPPGADADDARYGLANAYLFLGKYKEARKAFEDFSAAAPQHANAPSALFRVGETAYLLGDHVAARKALERFTTENPKHRHAETALSHLGDVYLRTGDLPKAKVAYQSVLKSAQGSLAARARLALARVQSSLAEYDQALAGLAELVKTGGPEWVDKAWFETGRVEQAAERFEKAIEAFETLEKVAAKSPLLAESKLLRADCLGRLNRRDESEALLKPLATSSGATAGAASDALGLSYLARGDAQAALTQFDEALGKFGRSPIAPSLALHAAEAAVKLGKPDDARTRYLKLSEAFPNDPLAEVAVLRAAALALDLRKNEEARDLAVGFLTRFPKSPLIADARLLEGRAVLAEGRAKEAAATLEDALTTAKPTPRTAQAIRYYLGLAYRADGQAAKAAEVLGALAKTSAAPAAVDAQFLLGQGHIEAGRFAEAIPALETYLEKKPKGEVADFALAHLVHAQIELGRADAAMKTLDDLATRFPKSKALNPSRLRLAESRLAAKEYPKAAELFSLAAESDEVGLKARALSGLGWSMLQSGKNEEAAEAFGKLLSVAPNDPLAADAALARGRALERSKQSEAALKAYERAASTYAKSSEAAGPALVAKGRLLVELKRPAEAGDAFDQAVKDHPKALGEPLDAVLADWGWALVDASKPEEADKVFNRLLAEFPDSPKAVDARFNLAESAFAAKKFDSIEELLKPVVAEGTKAPAGLVQSSLYRLGRTRVEKKSWSEAASIFERLATEFPDGPYRREAKFWRAEVAFQSGDAKTAEAGFAALGKEPAGSNDPPGFLGMVKGRQVQALLSLEQWTAVSAAASAFKAEFPKDPQLPEVLYAQGRAAQSLAKFDEARTAFDEVIALRKGSETAAKAQFMRGETYFHQKSYREALKDFLKVDYLYAAPAWQSAALLEAGKVHEQLSQWGEAAETYERLLAKKFPNDENADKARARLDAVRKRIAAAPGSSNESEAKR